MRGVQVHVHTELVGLAGQLDIDAACGGGAALAATLAGSLANPLVGVLQPVSEESAAGGQVVAYLVVFEFRRGAAACWSRRAGMVLLSGMAVSRAAVSSSDSQTRRPSSPVRQATIWASSATRTRGSSLARAGAE
ncbi:hypothetical protein [Streptomyces sp. BPTC-684]|uniref:hypothetical protein n=1 Tax=Streptomyces sp. BPTC-684 TaxID=3043734 RepID=UPI0024B0FAC6|nr:hypothetical protein [Streptomyces sp. BPTC-684]WHM39395.1 hypothetical protein QIY60_22615 [Streptomyces sp. BPTC-684]